MGYFAQLLHLFTLSTRLPHKRMPGFRTPLLLSIDLRHSLSSHERGRFKKIVKSSLIETKRGIISLNY